MADGKRRRAIYQIGITADATEFEKVLNQALESLDKLGQKPALVGQLQQASAAALDLAANLRTAVNQSTGKLDLTTFNKNLMHSGRTLEQYRDMLITLGPSGREAFLQVAQAITKAEMPLIRSNKLLSNLWTTMKNTVRWQLTSSALRGFIGALQTAYGYSKSLDASLNSIRVVTRQSTEDMARFAEQANKAAKELSTTTTDYTDASLVYYQQGLDDEEVQKRTDTTIKMANAANESAELVSQQLTAIWNNFYDGSKSLEYYADVMVALGASTASSSSEISEGIQKFASVGKTVGLSYEYSAAALATLTANTRESADIVGNSLKTLFSRIQGLKLGETLEDGTDLNKYSEALASVGVNIKDTNGELKDMDNILDETASKWGTLTRDQQMALAQTVAGVRQYTQFIALMENWGDFQENLNTALTSTGALQEQADIYAESWEAARKRVKAAAEDIYDSLINPDFYIGADDVLTPLLSGIADVIDAMGGMKGLLNTLGILMTSVYGDKIAQSMRDMATTLGFMTGEEQKRAIALQQNAAQLSQAAIYETTESEAIRLKMDAQKSFIDLQAQSAEYMNQLTPIQQENLRMDLEHIQNLYKQVEAYSEATAKAEQINDTYRNSIIDSIKDNEELVSKLIEVRDAIDQINFKVKKGIKITVDTSLIQKNISKIMADIMGIKVNIDTSEAIVSINSLLDTFAKLTLKQRGIEIIRNELQKIGGIAKGVTPEILQIAKDFELIGEKAELGTKGTNAFFRQLERGTGEAEKIQNAINLIVEALQILGTKVNDPVKFSGSQKNFESNLRGTRVATDELNKSITDLLNKRSTLYYEQRDMSQIIVDTSNQLMRLGMMIQSIKSLGSIWNDEDASMGEKIIQTLTSLGMIVPTLISLYKVLIKTGTTYRAVWMAGNKETVTAIVQSKLLKREKITESAAIGDNTRVVVANTAAWYANPIFLIATAIVGIIAVISIYNTKLEENTKKIRENAKAEAEAAQKIADEAKKEREELNDLYHEYIELKSNLDDSSESKEALKKHTEELCKALDVEWSALDKLQGKYEEVNKQIAEASKNKILENLKVTQDAIKSTQTSMLENASEYDESRDKYRYAVTFDAGAVNTDEKEIVDSFINALKEAGLNEDFLYTSENQDYQFRVNNAKELVKAYEAISNAIKEINADESLEGIRVESEVFQSAKQWITEYANDYDKIVGYQKDLVTYAEQLAEAQAAISGADLASVTTLEEYQKIKNTYVEELKKIFEDEEILPEGLEEGTPEFDEYFEGLAEQYLSGYAHLEDEVLKDQTLQGILEKVGEKNEGIIKKFVEDNKYDINILGILDWEILANEPNLEEKIKTAYEETKNKLQTKEFKETIPAVTSIMGDLSEGKELKDDQIQQLQALEEEYTKLGAIRNRTSAQYIQALRDIREGMESTVSRDALNDLTKAWDELDSKVEDDFGTTLKDSYEQLKRVFGEAVKVTIDLDSEDAMDQLNKIMDADYEVQLAIEADLKSDVDDIFNYAADVEKATGLIEEGFKVAYDDAMDLQSVFPGILAGYTIAADGMIQLDKEVAQQHLDSAATQIAADKEAAKQNLLDYQKVLLGKAAAMRTIAEGIQDLARTDKGESEKVADAKEKIENGITKLKDACADEQALISGNLALSEVDDSNQVLAANDNAATTSANNWAGAYESMAINSGKWADIAIKNANAVAKAMKGAEKGEVVTPEATMGGVFNRYSGGFEEAMYSGTYESADADEKSWRDYYEEGDLGKAAEEAIKDAEMYEAAAAAVGAQIAAIDGAAGSVANLAKTAGTGKGKGGGGGEKDNTGKILEPEDKKDFEEIEERYHEITREIERQNDLLDDINNNTERAYGIDKIKSYKKEQEALNKQLENQNKKLEEAENYLITDKTHLLELFPQAELNDKGEITNYTSLLQDTVDIYNSFIDSYNEYRATYSTWTKDQQESAEEELKSWEAQKDAAEEAYQERLEALKQYEDTLDTIQETRDNIEQLNRDIADNRLNQIEYRLEVILEVKDMKDAIRDFSKSIAESFGDAITHGIESAGIDVEGAQAEARMYPTYRQQYASLVHEYESTNSAEDRARIIKDIEELQSKVISSGEALLEWIETLDDLLPTAIEDARERFEYFTNWLDHNTTVLDTIKELYALQDVTYKTQQGYERLQRTSAEKMEALTNKAALNKSWYENASEQVEIARAKLESLGGNEEDVRWDIYKANYDALLAEQQAAQEAMLSSAQEAMEVAQEMATLSLEETMYRLDQQLSKGLGLDLLQDKYDHYIETEERYLDKVNEAYQVTAWYDKLQADIDNTTNKAMRDRLKALQEEIDTRREGNKLSQYDLDILEAKYKVLQAQVALEDAQNAKNQINLVRDRQGNWNYQFTANPEEVADAEQNLANTENEWYNIAKQQVEDVTGEIISTMQECSDSVQEIWQQMIDGTLTEEEGYARIAELRQFYTDKIKYLEEEKNVSILDMNEAGNKALLDMAILYGDEVSDLTGLTAEEVKNIIEESGMSIEELLLADNETIKNIVGSNTELIDLFDNVFARDLANMTVTAGNFEAYLDRSLSECENNWQNYGDRVNNIADTTGTSLDELNDQVDDVAESNEWLYDTGMMAVDALWDQLDAVRDLSEEYAELARSIMEVIEQQKQLSIDMGNYVESKASPIFDDNIDYSNLMASMIANGYTVDDPEFQKIQAKREEKINWLELQGKTEDYWGTRGQDTIDKFKNYENANLRDEWFNASANAYEDWEEKLRQQLLGFNTGGYTGEFNDAKLALLDEKELVLNQNDTKNILSAVSAVRSIGPELFATIEKMIDGNVNAAMSLLGERVSSFNQTTIPSTTIEQKVSIEHVEFPNVTSHDEIIQAFEGLTNDAAQWAQRRTS